MDIKTLWDTYSGAGAIVDTMASVREKDPTLAAEEIKAIEQLAKEIKAAIWPELNQAIEKANKE